MLLVPSDVPYLNAEALMAAQTLKSIGMNVDAQTMDWASIGARRAKRDAADAGGWNMYVTVAGEFDANSPDHQRLPERRLRQHRCPAGPATSELDELRTAWLKETVPGQAQGTARHLPDPRLRGRAVHQRRPVLAGECRARQDLKGADKLWAGMPVFWALDK